jgi:hypothetical protein
VELGSGACLISRQLSGACLLPLQQRLLALRGEDRRLRGSVHAVWPVGGRG